MARCAARIDARLLAALERADDGERPVAEVWRDVGAAAQRAGVHRPSYERVRTLVAARRAERPTRGGPRLGEVALDVAFRARPPEALGAQLAGTLDR